MTLGWSQWPSVTAMPTSSDGPWWKLSGAICRRLWLGLQVPAAVGAETASWWRTLEPSNLLSGMQRWQFNFGLISSPTQKTASSDCGGELWRRNVSARVTCGITCTHYSIAPCIGLPACLPVCLMRIITHAYSIRAPMIRFSPLFVCFFSDDISETGSGGSPKFSKFCSESFHRYTDRRVVFKFREILSDGKSVKSCVAYLTKKNTISPGSPAVAIGRIAPKICQGQPPPMCSECSRFHPYRFTFGGVIAERVNTAKTRRKVNPIFGWSLASSRIITANMQFYF